MKKKILARWQLYLLLLLPLLYIIIFAYVPMGGLIIAFKQYDFRKGILGSPWVGLKHFKDFFKSYKFFMVLKNTLTLSLYSLAISFPLPILFALLLNSMRSQKYAKVIQTVTYIPHFFSTVIMVGLLTQILSNPYEGSKQKVTFDPRQVYDFQLEKTLDEKVLLKQLGKAIDAGQKRSIEVDVSNTDRAFGTILGSEITRKLGDDVEEDTYHVLCKGAGGQSFGAFIPKGLTLELVGDSNDYFGKGLSGGKLVVYPPQGSKFKAEENIIIGNVALYGATSGKAFINGVAGERFCVRNSGAIAVVEGVGDHGCEYMTGGRVVVLGPTGKNFAAGMSGGIAYVLDEGNDLYKRLNKEMVSSSEITSKYDVLELKSMIQEHVALTNSAKGKEVLDNFGEYLPKFKKIIPHDYERVLKTIVQMEEKGLSAEQAQIEAFYANTRK